MMHRKLLILSGIVFSGTIALNGNLVWSQTKGSSGTPGAAGQESSDKPTTQKGSGASSMPSSSQDKGGSAAGSSGSGSGSQMDRAERSSASGSSARGMSGQSSENIKQVQEALKNKGHDPGPADGVMGPKTQQALRAFQKDSGMQATGRLDDKTASALGVDASGSGTSGTKGQR